MKASIKKKIVVLLFLLFTFSVAAPQFAMASRATYAHHHYTKSVHHSRVHHRHHKSVKAKHHRRTVHHVRHTTHA